MKRLVVSLIVGMLVLAGCGREDGAQEPLADDHNQTDLSFASGMIPHHQQAIVMSDMAATQAQSPEVKNLAAHIKAGQEPEIRLMQGLLSRWGATAKPGTPGGDHTGHGAAHGGGAAHPGVLNETQLGQLRSSSGNTFDRLFLDYMIFHHEGAVITAQDELNAGVSIELRNLARSIIDTQRAEIREMKGLLARLGGSLLSPTQAAAGQPAPGIPAPGQATATGPAPAPGTAQPAGPAQSGARSGPGQPAPAQPRAGRPAPAPSGPSPAPAPAPSPVGGGIGGGGGTGGGCTPEHQEQGHCH